MKGIDAMIIAKPNFRKVSSLKQTFGRKLWDRVQVVFTNILLLTKQEAEIEI
jgi:hypothetical protein